MPRRKYVAVSEFPYHISNRCNNKEWFELPMEEVWDIFASQILDSSDRFAVYIHAFVLMSNHFHLMAQTPLSNLDAFLRHFLTEVARKLKRKSQRINHMFGGRSSSSILDSAYSVAYVYKYILRNPVRAGVASRVEEYPFSSFARSLRGKYDLPLVEGSDPIWRLVPKRTGERLLWLNLPTDKEREGLISQGLRHSRFRFSCSNTSRKDFVQLARSYAINFTVDDPYLLGPKGE